MEVIATSELFRKKTATALRAGKVVAASMPQNGAIDKAIYILHATVSNFFLSHTISEECNLTSCISFQHPYIIAYY